MSKLQSLFISMEDDSLNETELVVAADDTIEVEIADAGAAESEASEAGEGADEMMEMSEGLEAIVVSMEAAMQDGGLTPQAALFMTHAVGAYTNRLGLSASSITPSLESFGGASGQAAATTISMEGIKETLKKIWIAIKNAVSKAIAAIKNFFAKIFGGVAKLKQRADALRKAVAEVKDEAGEEINVPSANVLRYKGKADISSIVAGLKATKTAGDDMYGNVLTIAQAFYKQSVDKVLNRTDLNEAAEAELKKQLDANDRGVVEVFSKSIVVSALFSGDATFKISHSADGENGASGGGSMPTLVKGFGHKALDDAHTKIASPKKAELLNVLSGIDALISQMEAKKKSLEGLTKAREDALKATEKAVEGWANKAKEGAKQSLASLIMRKVNRDVTRPINQLYSHQFAVVRAGLALVERGVASHKKGPAKKK